MLLVRLIISGCQPIRSQSEESVLTAIEIHHPLNSVAFFQKHSERIVQSETKSIMRSKPCDAIIYTLYST